MSQINFKTVSLPLRLYSGKDALENLPGELKRRGSSRAMILCGRSVSRKTELISRMRGILGATCAGVFDEIEKDSTLASVLAATAAAREAKADLLIGVGGGSVLQATRVVAVLLAESRPIEQLITQYPEHGPAISARLLAPKLPIINVLTLPTTAQNRGGSGVRNDALDHRMEFFDPKTRPQAVFWDAEALLTAPVPLALQASCSVYWRSVMNLAYTDINPLIEGVRLHGYRLAQRALPKIKDPTDPAPRIELCAAAFLLNRDADEGGNAVPRPWALRVPYAFATGLFSNFPHVGQGEAYTALTGASLRCLGARDALSIARLAREIGAWNDSMPVADAPSLAADQLERYFADLGMPTKLRDLRISREGLAKVLENSLKNFNADPRREFVRERESLAEVLDRAW